ncbi:hypothetical protein PSTT_00220 [Puccinia striiformis]|uniref:CBM21 domain-containing protein n=1 Tax=Puccinia striiformis TaxID=27350 RepID=A0A2S4W7Z0_9BASI|nr:hypothetical protein PSTT_00220 [Puccinia striiformis]
MLYATTTTASPTSTTTTALVSPPSSLSSADSLSQIVHSMQQLSPSPPHNPSSAAPTARNHIRSINKQPHNSRSSPNNSNPVYHRQPTKNLTIDTSATITHSRPHKMFTLETPPPSNSESSTPSSAATARATTPTSATTPSHCLHHKSYSYQFPVVNFNSPTPPSTDKTDYFDGLTSPTQRGSKPNRPLHQKAQSETAMRLELPHSFPSSSLDNIPMLRKKSGEVVRSSLKLSSMGTAPSSRSNSYSNSRSAPSTPTHGPKAVHFDAHLEHVRHFLSQQRPIAVSRDGSPVETETEGEEEYPFPDMDSSGGRSGRSKLVIELPNMPLNPSLGADKVCLKSIELAPDGKNLKGTVLVENLSFEKRVAVRFTFDKWQTVSEVTADYISSQTMYPNKLLAPPGLSKSVDLFGFTIKLQDVLARIEEREMEVAVRYLAAGGEYWDNNSSANYHVRFKNLRNGPQQSANNKQVSHVAMSRSQAPETSMNSTTNQTGTTDPCPWAVTLRAELDRLVGDDLGISAGIPGLKKKGPSASFSSGSPRLDALSAGSHLRAGTGLSARYDFGLSLKQAASSQHARPNRFEPSLPVAISNVPVEWIGISPSNGFLDTFANSEPHSFPKYQPQHSQPTHQLHQPSSYNKRWSVPAIVPIPNLPPSPPQDCPSNLQVNNDTLIIPQPIGSIRQDGFNISSPILHQSLDQPSFHQYMNSGLVTPQSPSLTNDSI